MMKKSLKSSSRGTSLIEVLVALLLFSFGILGFVALQARATAFSLDAEDRTRAAMLANELIATMWLQGTNSLPTATINAWQTKVKDPAASGLSVPTGNDPTVSTDATTGVTTITISWRAPSKATTEAVNQYITSVSIQ